MRDLDDSSLGRHEGLLVLETGVGRRENIEVFIRSLVKYKAAWTGSWLFLYIRTAR